MAAQLEIDNYSPLILKERTYLSADASAGATELSVANSKFNY